MLMKSFHILPTSISSKKALRVSSLYKSFGMIKVLHNLNLDIGMGERVALMGRSGSGKSTLLNCICGIESFQKGCVEVNNVAVDSENSSRMELLRRLYLGYVFQSFHLLPTLTALENVEFPAQLVNTPDSDRKDRAYELLSLVGMQHRQSHLPHTLSGGERQRVALARAVINRPRLILADEPTGSLDTSNGNQILDLIEKISIEEEIALLLVTHDNSVIRICDRVVHMIDGQITKA